MKTDLFLPGIWDRLMAASQPPVSGASSTRPAQTLAQLHASIARDLEDLFIRRLALAAWSLDVFLGCRETGVNFVLIVCGSV